MTPPPQAYGTGGMELPPPGEYRPTRRSNYPSQTEIAEAVDEARFHDRLARLETEFDEFKRDFKERRHLSVAAKATIAAAIIGVLGSISVVGVQAAIAFRKSTADDSIKQSTTAAAQVVASSTPGITESYQRVADQAAATALDQLRKLQQEQDKVVVPRAWVIKGKLTQGQP